MGDVVQFPRKKVSPDGLKIHGSLTPGEKKRLSKDVTSILTAIRAMALILLILGFTIGFVIVYFVLYLLNVV